MAGIPTGCEDYDEWINKNAAWDRLLARREREERFAEATFEEDRDGKPEDGPVV